MCVKTLQMTEYFKWGCEVSAYDFSLFCFCGQGHRTDVGSDGSPMPV